MKKQWISVKCGLSRDPKHRQAMGEGVWLFLHILDIASWDDGIVHDWKDEAAAEDMGMPVRTLREHRRKLSDLGYITCIQKQYTQDIVIHNWTNPREYSGNVYNQKQGDRESSPEENQGYTQGYTQGSRKDVTPTLDSNNQISKAKKSLPANSGVDWLVAANVSSEEIAAVNDKIGQEAAVANLYESAMGYNPLNWRDKDMPELLRFLMTKSEAEIRAFAKWSRAEYSTFQPAKARQFPLRVKEFWPLAFAASENNSTMQAPARSVNHL